MVTYKPLMAFEFLRTPVTLGTRMEKLSVVRGSEHGAGRRRGREKRNEKEKDK